MDDWIEYYDSPHTIYASERHRDVHFETIARDIGAYIPAPDAVVLDYACGEALSADKVAAACGRLILAEPAPRVRQRLAARMASRAQITVCALDDLAAMEPRSVDLAVMNSVAQYMTPQELDMAFATVARLLKPTGRLVVGDVIDPQSGMAADVIALLRFGAAHGFFIDAAKGLARTAFSDYRRVRSRAGLARYSDTTMVAKLTDAGYGASRAPANIGHNPSRKTFVARLAPDRRC